jgi:hypothetical protein
MAGCDFPKEISACDVIALKNRIKTPICGNYFREVGK